MSGAATRYFYSLQKFGKRGMVGITLLLLSSLLLGYGMLQLVPIGADWHFHFFPTLQAYLRGATRLYDGGEGILFYEPPWTILLLMPFAILPEDLGLALLRVLSLACLVLVADFFAPPGHGHPFAVALACASLWTLDLLVAGALSAFVALGLWVNWWGIQRQKPWAWVVGMAFMGIKPQLVLLPALASLVWIRTWPRGAQWQALLGLAGVAGLSFLVSGWDWPLRWIGYTREAPPYYGLLSTSYRAAQTLGIPAALVVLGGLVITFWVIKEVVRSRPSRRVLMLLTAANAVVTPYILARDFPIQMVVCWPTLVGRNRPFAAVAYALSFLPLLRLPFGRDVTWVDASFALVLFLGVAWHYLSSRNQLEASRDE